jgi:N-formylglutamate amidohydrolase
MEIYTILKNDVRIPIVANIPHSSTFIPTDIRKSFLISDEEVERELLLLTDRYVDELFSSVHESGGTTVRYNISRIVVDAERFENDKEEVMSKKGMGVIYTKTSNGKDLRGPLLRDDRKKLLETYYHSYHRAIENEVQSLLKKFGKCLIIDCHSFSSIPLGFELDQDPERPDICIGTDKIHTPPSLIDAIENYFNNISLRTFRNKPYSGTYLPLKYLAKEERVFSVMIEINRRLYMDESTGEKNNSFIKIKSIAKELITGLSAWV